MKSPTPIVILAIASILAVAPASAQGKDVALHHIAEQLGYGYAYLGPQDAVALTRPGLTILLRPGETTFDVNDRTETTSQAPRFYRDDLYVSPDLAARLGKIAAKYPRTQRIVIVSQAMAGMSGGMAHGAISLDVRQQPGSESVAVSGKAPPAVPITVTVMGTLSRDLPDVLVSRQEIASDALGRFQAIVPIAPNYFRGSILTLVASSVPGVTSARAQVTVGAPNGSVTPPVEQLPRSFQ